MNRAVEEMDGINLRDKRLTKRLLGLLTTLADNAQLSIPSACGGWAETKAAYRFFDNPNVSDEKILLAEEWQVAYSMTYQKKPPDKPISLACMITLIAQFGGYLNRKSDTKPGPTMLWIGFAKITSIY